MKKFLIAGLLLLSAQNSFAVSVDTGAKDKPVEAAKDEYERDTPRDMVAGFMDAIADKDYEKAANYLNLNAINKDDQKDQGPELAKNLHKLLDQSGWIRSSTIISNDPVGNIDDDLPPEEEKIGGIRTSQKIVPIIAERIEKKEPYYWVISSETVSQIPALAKNIKEKPLNKYMPKVLLTNEVRGIPVGHWLALIGLGIFSYFVMWGITDMMRHIINSARARIYKTNETNPIIEAFVKPVQLYLSVWISILVIRYIGVSVLARAVFGQIAFTAGWIALAWIAWRLIDVFADVSRQRLIKHGQYNVLSAIVFMRRAAKFALFSVVTISILDGFGYQITTWLAALGIGGIAIALGAQKTIENFVGSLTLIADRPIAIGDFCKFGDNKGTIEDIGMRSTRIRTADRTLVTIPNGDFVSMSIENYSKRDNFSYTPRLNLRNDLNPDEIRKLLVKLRAFLGEEKKINQQSMTVFFTGFGEASFYIDISANIMTRVQNEANAIMERLNLGILDIMLSENVSFAPAKIYAEKAK